MKNMHFEMLPVCELFIAIRDPQNRIGYNRPVQIARARKYSKNFDMKLVGTIIISHRDGVYYIVDGQHRTQAAKIKGIKTLPCLVHEGLTYQEEAELFVKLQKERKGLIVAELFNGECESGDLHAIELKDAILAAGYNIGKGQGNYKVQAVQVLKRIYDRDGAQVVTDVLEVIKDAWNGSHTANVRLVLLGIWQFLSVYHHEFGRDRLISTLQKTPPADIIRGARGDVSGRSDATKAAMVILNIYNKGLTKKLINRFE